MSKPLDITDKNLKETIKDGVTMIDFWAPWCGPCRMIAPIIEDLVDDFAGKVTITKCNTDDNQAIAVKYGIRSIPTIMFFKDGELVDQVVGAQSKQSFTEKLNELLK